MTITLVSMIGLLATVVSTGVLVPTAVKMYYTKKVNGVEPMMVSQALLANVLWVAYGGLAGDEYVLGRALLAGFFSAATLAMYYMYRKV